MGWWGGRGRVVCVWEGARSAKTRARGRAFVMVVRLSRWSAWRVAALAPTRRGAPKICPRNKPKSGSEADARLERCLTDRVIRGPDSARRRHGDESLRRGSDSDAVGPCPARQRCHGAVIPVAYDVQLYIIIESSNAPPRDILTKVGYKTEYSTKTLQTFRL